MQQKFGMKLPKRQKKKKKTTSGRKNDKRIGKKS